MFALLQLARAAIGAAFSRAGLATLGTAAALDIGPFGDGERKRRRRRKRALTASDREDLLFLGSLMSKAGVERVAAVMISRT